MFSTLVYSLLFFSTAGAQGFLPTAECPLLGPVFPSNFDLSQTDAFKEAKEAFPGVIDKLFESGVVNSSTLTFVIDIYSAHTNESLYTYTHQASAPVLNETFPAELNDETIFKVGSISKLVTVYSILAKTGDLKILDHPVTDYLPELAGNPQEDSSAYIPWEKVTVGALAAHLTGAGPFPLGFIGCDPPLQCTADEFLAAMKKRVATQPLFRSTIYSDAGFGILGRVLERLTGLAYNEALQEVLSTPLGLKSISAVAPTGENVNAVAGPNVWGSDNPITAPSGGLYSSAADLRTIGLSILHSTLLSPSDTRQWMKPHGHTASLTNSVGAPWEINRMTLPVSTGSNRTRVSDLYTKAGAVPSYSGIFALSPDHGLGISVLTVGAGANDNRWTLRAAAAETFVTAAELAAAEHAAPIFPGTFVDDALDTNLTLAIEEDNAGISLKSFYVAGEDLRSFFITPDPTFELPEGSDVIVHIYPSGVEYPAEEGISLIQYRAVAQITPFKNRSMVEGGSGLFDDHCTTWLSVAGVSMEDSHTSDAFILKMKGNELTEISYPALNATLKRV